MQGPIAHLSLAPGPATRKSLRTCGAAIMTEASSSTRMTMGAERLARAGDVLVLRRHCSDAEPAAPYQPLLEQIERIEALFPSPCRGGP